MEVTVRLNCTGGLINCTPETAHIVDWVDCFEYMFVMQQLPRIGDRLTFASMLDAEGKPFLAAHTVKQVTHELSEFGTECVVETDTYPNYHVPYAVFRQDMLNNGWRHYPDAGQLEPNSVMRERLNRELWAAQNTE